MASISMERHFRKVRYHKITYIIYMCDTLRTTIKMILLEIKKEILHLYDKGILIVWIEMRCFTDVFRVQTFINN